MKDKTCPLMEQHYPNPQGDAAYEEEGISLKELLLVLIRGKKSIALVTAVVLLITLCGSVLADNLTIGSKGSVQSAMQIYFEEIHTGLAPDGNIYDVNELKSAEILQRALDNVAFSSIPDISKLSSSISIESVLPEDAAKTLRNISDLKTEALKLERLEALEIYPDTFVVTLDVNNFLNITKEEGRELLDNIILEYRVWLMEKYAGYQVLASVFSDGFSLDHYDYAQIADLLNNQLAKMLTYVEENITDRDFTSTTTGFSREALLSEIEALRTIEVEQLYTNVATFYITKNAGKSVAVYEKLAEDKDRIAAQRSEEAAAIYNLILNYKKDQQTLVMGSGSEETFSLQTQSAQYDKMMLQYIAAGTEAAAARADGDYYRAEANRFSEAVVVSGPDSPEAASADQLIEKIQGKLTYATDLVNRTTEEFYGEAAHQRYAEQIIPAQDYEMGTSVNLPLNLAIGLVAGLLLGVLVVLFRAYMREDEDKQKKEVTADETY